MSDINEEQKRLYKRAEENDIKLLQEENNRLNNIINELQDRIDKAVEYIDKNTEFNHDGNEYGYMEWMDIINVSTLEFVDDLKSILKGDNK